MAAPNSAVHVDRKRAHIARAQACGARHTLEQAAGTDPISFLTALDPEMLTARDRKARDALLPTTWQGAFARGWRNARQ